MFVVPESDADKPENRFEFQIGEKKYSVPKFGFAPTEAVIHFQAGENLLGLFACMDAETEMAVRALDQKQLSKLDDEWTKASKVSPGESQGSADS